MPIILERVPLNIVGPFKYKAKNDEFCVYYSPAHHEMIREFRINKHIAGDLHIIITGGIAMSAGKGTVKDYYSILGVPATASQAEIKSAWKKLVKEWHPDVCRLADAHVRFIEISEAYEVLQDEYARHRYDYLVQENLQDLLRSRRQRDFRRGQSQTHDQAGHFAVLPLDLMLETAVNLAQYIFLNWYSAALLYPFGYLDRSESRQTS